VSDALGTATEMRAMKNYAGHRLSPWLGHLMVSRQETARPLLTPGEIMQLPPHEELVLVSGALPIRAQKARYFKDPQLQARILPPPASKGVIEAPAASGADDWSSVPPIAPDLANSPGKATDGEDADYGIRREPEIPEHEDIAPEPPAPAREEFAALDDEPDDDAQRAKQLQDRFRGVARQASLDPEDGIEL
jgi:type IV secretion system protein VirD4